MRTNGPGHGRGRGAAPRRGASSLLRGRGRAGAAASSFPPKLPQNGWRTGCSFSRQEILPFAEGAQESSFDQIKGASIRESNEVSLKGALYWDRPPLRNVVTASCGRPSDDDGYPDGDLLRRRRRRRRLLQFAFGRSVRSLSSGADCRRRGGRTNELSECKRRREGREECMSVQRAARGAAEKVHRERKSRF